MRLACDMPKFSDPDAWIEAVKCQGYSAAHVPVGPEIGDADLADFIKAAAAHGIMFAEVGAWGNNPVDPDTAKAQESIAHCQRHLDLAERTGARCCVNVSGSRHPHFWAGPNPENFSQATFDLIVESVRKIIDAVKPKRTFYTLETMPWIFPSSPDEYLALMKAVDRPAFAAHLDPVNLIKMPALYFRNGNFIRECFAKLGPFIKSCHAKDIILGDSLTVHLDECRPGTGSLDYVTFLTELSKLDPDTPICLEHLPAEEFPLAAQHVRKVAKENGIALR